MDTLKKKMSCLLMLLMALCITSSVSSGVPVVSGRVVVEGDTTRYIYTVTNYVSDGVIYGLYNMRLPDKNIPINHREPPGWGFWHPKPSNTAWSIFYWSGVSVLRYGESADFEIYTTSSVTTTWWSDWVVAVIPAEGRTYGYSDGTPLPVPVPEPASLLILSAGLAGFAGAIRRRRGD